MNAETRPTKGHYLTALCALTGLILAILGSVHDSNLLRVVASIFFLASVVPAVKEARGRGLGTARIAVRLGACFLVGAALASAGLFLTIDDPLARIFGIAFFLLITAMGVLLWRKRWS